MEILINDFESHSIKYLYSSRATDNVSKRIKYLGRPTTNMTWLGTYSIRKLVIPTFKVSLPEQYLGL